MTEARPIVEEILRLITETEGPAEKGMDKATKFLENILHIEKVMTLRQAGAEHLIPQYIEAFAKARGLLG